MLDKIGRSRDYHLNTVSCPGIYYATTEGSEGKGQARAKRYYRQAYEGQGTEVGGGIKINFNIQRYINVGE